MNRQKLDQGRIRELIHSNYLRINKHPFQNLFILNYNKKFFKQNPTELLHFRGTIINEKFEQISVPFKFFQEKELEFLKSNFRSFKRVAMKLDGVLLVSYYIDGKHFLASKGSFISFHSQIANKLLIAEKFYKNMKSNVSYLFELLSIHSTIVTNNENQSSLILIGAFNIETKKCVFDEEKNSFQSVKIYTSWEEANSAFEHNENEGIVALDEYDYPFKIKTSFYKSKFENRIKLINFILEAIKNSPNIEAKDLISSAGHLFDDLQFETIINASIKLKKYIDSDQLSLDLSRFFGSQKLNSDKTNTFSVLLKCNQFFSHSLPFDISNLK